MKRLAALVLCALAVAGCGDVRSAEQPRVAAAERIPITFDALTETSGAVASVAQPGVIFTINDSGNEPEIYAIDSLGRGRGIWRLAGARNTDWEAMSAAACDDDSGPPARCLVVADIGDNLGRRTVLHLHRVRMPVTKSGPITTERVRPDSRLVRLGPGPRDIEAMYVGPSGVTYFITKRPDRASGGVLRPALVLALPPGPWTRNPTDTAVATLIDSLPIIPGSAVMRTITDAALSMDGRWVAVRTYAEVYVFAADPSTGRIDTRIDPTRCDISALDEPGGEAITWLADGRLVLLSEGRREPMYRLRCDPPRTAQSTGGASGS